MKLETIQKLKNKEKIINYTFYIYLLILSICFIILGVFSYLNIKNLLFFYTNKIIFFPQGITVLTYGFLGIIISVTQLRNNNLNTGEGKNKITFREIIVIRKNLEKNLYIKIKFEIKNILRKKDVL